MIVIGNSVSYGLGVVCRNNHISVSPKLHPGHHPPEPHLILGFIPRFSCMAVQSIVKLNEERAGLELSRMCQLEIQML